MKVYIDARGQKGFEGEDRDGNIMGGGAAARIKQEYIVDNEFCQTLVLKYAIRAGGIGGGRDPDNQTKNNRNFGGDGGDGIIIQYQAQSKTQNLAPFWSTLMIAGGGGGGGATKDYVAAQGGGVYITETPLRTTGGYDFYKGLNGGAGGKSQSYGQGAENVSEVHYASTAAQAVIDTAHVNGGGNYGGKGGDIHGGDGETYSARNILGGKGGAGGANGYKRGGGGGGGGVSGGGGGGARNSNAGGGGAGSTMVINTFNYFQLNLASISSTDVVNWNRNDIPHFIVKVYKDNEAIYDACFNAINTAQQLTITLNNQPTLQDISKQITSNTDTILKADLQGYDEDGDDLTYVLDGDCQFNDGNTTNLNLTSLSTNPFTIDENNNMTFTIPEDHNVNSLNYYKNNFYCQDRYGGVSGTKVITYYTGKTGYNINGYDFNYYYQRRNTINEITPPLSLFKVNGFDLSRYFWYQVPFGYSLSTDNYSGFLNNPIDKDSIRYTNDVYPTSDMNQLLKKLTSTYPKPN